jgi:predicted transcriptional regulator
MAQRKAKAGTTRTPAKKKTPSTGGKSKQQRMIEMLQRPEGATIAQLSKAFGWELHTVRGALSGALKKKLGLKIASEKPEGGERVYRIA